MRFLPLTNDMESDLLEPWGPEDDPAEYDDYANEDLEWEDYCGGE